MMKFYIPPALLIYSIVTMVLLYIFIPEFNHISFPINLIGLVISTIGFILMGKVRDLFRKHQTQVKLGKPNFLVKEGVFSKSRNPMYVGMFIMVLGFSIFSTNVLALFLPLIFIILVRVIFIRKEEKIMYRTFGQEYIDYKNKVRRWI